jgi:hypothetical protein
MPTERSEQRAYDELQCYTLERGDPDFIHQHVVDAWTAQHADERTKPIGLTFALIGLYLHLERGLTGRQVQQAHMKLARSKRTWPSFPLPRDRGSVTVIQVVEDFAGSERDRAVDSWCASVWGAFCDSHPAIADLLRNEGIV